MNLDSLHEHIGNETSEEAREALSKLTLEELQLFIESLEQMDQAAKKKAEEDSADWQTDDVHMADFGDNEVASVWRGYTEKLREIEAMKKIAFEIQEQKSA